MWMMTPRGFYSVVQHRDDGEIVLVRARARADLVRLQDAHPALREYEIAHTPSADYPARLIIPRAEWNRALEILSDEIDYDNFKNAVKERQHAQRAATYLGVWSKLHQIEWEERKPEEYAQPHLQGFHDRPDEWRCDTCLLDNDDADTRCWNCGDPRRTDDSGGGWLDRVLGTG